MASSELSGAWVREDWISPFWRFLLYLVLGLLIGLIALIARAANVTSYLSDRPETCINCHVMNDAYGSYRTSSHGRVAVCNDCHVPHQNLLGTYAFKARDGLRHATVFTFRLEPQVLRLNPAAIEVVQDNCTRCHKEQLTMIRLAGTEERRCWDCHQNIHGEVRSLSASPHLLRDPQPPAGFGH